MSIDKLTCSITSRSPTSLIDAIDIYQAQGYDVEKIWYEYGWFWVINYYAKLIKRQPQPPSVSPSLEFVIGPITLRELPKSPSLPHLEFVIGPVKQ